MKNLLLSLLLAIGLFFTGGSMQATMEQVNGSFVRSIGGEITTPTPTVRLIHDRGEFSQFLSDRTLFFDGRFAFYETVEGGNYFEEHDLIAVIVKGEHKLQSLEKEGTEWQVALEPLGGENVTMYFITVEKDMRITKAVLSVIPNGANAE